MRPFEIVDCAPGIEGALHLGEIAEALEREHLGLQRAVEALVLAAALRMIGSAVQDSDAELEQPHAEPGPALAGGIAPRVAVVDEEGLRQAVAAERQLQPVLHGAALLVGAGRKAQIVARMVVDHGQRMASAAARKRHVALEVHLPEQVGRGLLKAQVGRSPARRRNDPAMPAQDFVHRRERRTGSSRRVRGSARSCARPRPDAHRATPECAASIAARSAPGSNADAASDPPALHRPSSGRATCSRCQDGSRTAGTARAGSLPPAAPSRTNSRRCSIIDTSRHGMDGLLAADSMQ